MENFILAQDLNPVDDNESPFLDESNFPIDTLPPALHRFVWEKSEALSIPPDLLALPVLVAVGTAIGNSFCLQPKEGWKESAAIYGAVIAEPGSMKSAAIDAALAPIRNNSDTKMRTWSSDVTVERFAQLLEKNPRGICIIRDELSGLFRSMNKYKAGKGDDLEFYLTGWGGQSQAIDRKNGTEIYLETPFVSIVGAIPPQVLIDIGRGNNSGDGFLERFLWAFPDPRPVRFSQATVRPSTQNIYEEGIRYLYGLPLDGKHNVLSFSPEAQEFFETWHNSHMQEAESNELSPFLKGIFGKLKGYCARLALIHALCSPQPTISVEIRSVSAAAAMVDYFKTQARKVNQLLGRGAPDPIQRTKEAVRRQLSVRRCMGRRDLQRKMNGDAKIFHQALLEMSQPEISIRRDGNNREYISLLSGTDNRQTDGEGQ